MGKDKIIERQDKLENVDVLVSTLNPENFFYLI